MYRNIILHGCDAVCLLSSRQAFRSIVRCHSNPTFFFFFFFNDTATTEIYTLSLHDALPISRNRMQGPEGPRSSAWSSRGSLPDRKSTRLNSSHLVISYAVFCLKKKKKQRVLDRILSIAGV